MKRSARITLSADAVLSKIDERLYGSFIEHMGRAVYTGVYEPDHPSADAKGFRQDVIELIRPLRIPLIRYPGGNFVSGYRWEDGVGPKGSRPVRADLAWQAIEPNQFGTNEFMDFLSLLGARPMLAVNLGARGPQNAADLVEYCNFPGGTQLSELRAAHGYPKPHGVKLWALGNEMDGPWQIGAKTAEEYGRAAHESAKMMRLLDPAIELVVCGSSFREMPTFGEWERAVLRHCYEDADYLSLHSYYQNPGGDIPSFLAGSARMDAFIREVQAICRQIKAEKGSKKDVYLSFDEWNVWYHYQKDAAAQGGAAPPKWIVARPIEEELYDFADALLIGALLITLINHCDFVKIACLAQLVNTLAPIMTRPGGKAWAQTTYYPFLYTSQRGRGTALRPSLDAPRYACAAGEDVPLLDMAAVLSGDQSEIVLFMVNKSSGKELACEMRLDGFAYQNMTEWIALYGHAFDAVNTEESAPVRPRAYEGDFICDNAGVARFTLPAASWNMIRLAVGKGGFIR